MSELILSIIIDAVIVIMSILLVKKVKPNKSNLLNLAFGTFWLGVAGIYLFSGLTDVGGMLNSVYLSRLTTIITLALVVIPVFCLALFLSATSLKKTTLWILPAITGLIGLSYLYLVTTNPLAGPEIGWTVKYYIQNPEALMLIQYTGYLCFTLASLLALIAFRARKTSIFIQFNSVALSMGLFFLGGYLDLIGTTGIETVLIRLLIVIGAIIGYIGFAPGIKLMKIAHKLS